MIDKGLCVNHQTITLNEPGCQIGKPSLWKEYTTAWRTKPARTLKAFQCLRLGISWSQFTRSGELETLGGLPANPAIINADSITIRPDNKPFTPLPLPITRNLETKPSKPVGNLVDLIVLVGFSLGPRLIVSPIGDRNRSNNEGSCKMHCMGFFEAQYVEARLSGLGVYHSLIHAFRSVEYKCAMFNPVGEDLTADQSIAQAAANSGNPMFDVAGNLVIRNSMRPELDKPEEFDVPPFRVAFFQRALFGTFKSMLTHSREQHLDI